MSLPVHPTQLYESAFALALFFLLLAWRKRVRRGGELFALFFVLYPLGRFFDEFLRGDERGTLFGLSLPQVFSLAAVAVAACAVASMRRSAPGVAATAAHTI
jgi:phosphatidylglycerol:prolipoprotein diacylglycerol transferase